MSKSLVPKTDAGSGVMSEVGNTAVNVGVTVASLAAFTMLPIGGTVALIAGLGYLGVRAVKRGLGKSKR